MLDPIFEANITAKAIRPAVLLPIERSMAPAVPTETIDKQLLGQTVGQLLYRSELEIEDMP